MSEIFYLILIIFGILISIPIIIAFLLGMVSGVKKELEKTSSITKLSELDYEYLDFFNDYLEKQDKLKKWYEEGNDRFYYYPSDSYSISFRLNPRWKNIEIYFLKSKIPKKDQDKFEDLEKYSKDHHIHKITLTSNDNYYQMIKKYHLLYEERIKKEFLITHKQIDNDNDN